MGVAQEQPTKAGVVPWGHSFPNLHSWFYKHLQFARDSSSANSCSIHWAVVNMSSALFRSHNADVKRDGNDGSWSSFGLQIGTPPQTMKVLISTAGTQTMLVAPEGCGAGDPINCKKLRGEFFNFNESSTYSPLQVNLSSSIYALTLESELGYSGKGKYGFDDISFSWQGKEGPTVKNQTVAGIATKDFYLGLLGLNPSLSNFGSYNNPLPSLMENMRSMSLIPSISWGYTAGNQYRRFIHSISSDER